MDLKAQREAAIAELREMNGNVKDGVLSAEQSARITELSAVIADIDMKLKSAGQLEQLLGSEAPDQDAPVVAAKTFGDLFVKSAGYEAAVSGRYGERAELKAATDVHSLEELGDAFESKRVLPTLGEPTGDALSLFDWLRPQAIDEHSVFWVEETLAEGEFKIVKPGDLKPQLHFGYEAKSDTLHTAAGWFDSHVSQIRRAPQYAAEINRRGLRKLRLDQERLVMNATVVADGFNGLLNTSGLGTVTAASQAEWFDKIYEAVDQAEQLGEFPVDGIALSRSDWGKMRLSKDAEGKYLAGGPFSGAVAERLWNIPVYVTSQLTAGTALVAASQNANVWTERSVHVDVTNSDGDKFRRNIVTTRIEQDILAHWTRPAGGVKVALTA